MFKKQSLFTKEKQETEFDIQNKLVNVLRNSIRSKISNKNSPIKSKLIMTSLYHESRDQLKNMNSKLLENRNSSYNSLASLDSYSKNLINSSNVKSLKKESLNIGLKHSNSAVDTAASEFNNEFSKCNSQADIQITTPLSTNNNSNFLSPINIEKNIENTATSTDFNNRELPIIYSSRLLKIQNTQSMPNFNALSSRTKKAEVPYYKAFEYYKKVGNLSKDSLFSNIVNTKTDARSLQLADIKKSLIEEKEYRPVRMKQDFDVSKLEVKSAAEQRIINKKREVLRNNIENSNSNFISGSKIQRCYISKLPEKDHKNNKTVTKNSKNLQKYLKNKSDVNLKGQFKYNQSAYLHTIKNNRISSKQTPDVLYNISGIKRSAYSTILKTEVTIDMQVVNDARLTVQKEVMNNEQRMQFRYQVIKEFITNMLSALRYCAEKAVIDVKPCIAENKFMKDYHQILLKYSNKVLSQDTLRRIMTIFSYGSSAKNVWRLNYLQFAVAIQFHTTEVVDHMLDKCLRTLLDLVPDDDTGNQLCDVTFIKTKVMQNDADSDVGNEDQEPAETVLSADQVKKDKIQVSDMSFSMNDAVVYQDHLYITHDNVDIDIDFSNIDKLEGIIYTQGVRRHLGKKQIKSIERLDLHSYQKNGTTIIEGYAQADKNLKEIQIDEKYSNDLENRSKHQVQELTSLLKHSLKLLDKNSRSKLKVTLVNKRKSLQSSMILNVFKNIFLDTEQVKSTNTKLCNFIQFSHNHKIPLTRDLVYKTFGGQLGSEVKNKEFEDPKLQEIQMDENLFRYARKHKVQFDDDQDCNQELLSMMREYLVAFNRPADMKEVDIMADFKEKIHVGSRQGNVNQSADNLLLFNEVNRLEKHCQEFRKLKDSLRGSVENIDEKMIF